MTPIPDANDLSVDAISKMILYVNSSMSSAQQMQVDSWNSDFKTYIHNHIRQRFLRNNPLASEVDVGQWRYYTPEK